MGRPELRSIDAEPPGSTIVERLEGVLALAKEGKLSSCAIAFVYRDGFTGNVWSDAPSLSLLIGATERLKYSMIREAEGE